MGGGYGRGIVTAALGHDMRDPQRRATISIPTLFSQVGALNEVVESRRHAVSLVPPDSSSEVERHRRWADLGRPVTRVRSIHHHH